MNEAAHEAETIVVEIRLRDGETIKAKTKDMAGTSIGGLHQALQGSEFVQVGEDTIVRSRTSSRFRSGTAIRVG